MIFDIPYVFSLNSGKIYSAMKSREAISRPTFYLLAIFFSIISLADLSYADIYSFVDGKGIQHFTNTPIIDKRYRFKWRARRTIIKPFGAYAYSKSYEEEILRASKRYNLDPDLVKAIIKVESNFSSTAVSQKGL
jgi:soluble lytic murein transglycosylase-like protein